jgi:membrane protease YdiL (CAAX protease family)
MAQEPVTTAPLSFFAFVGEDERVVWRVAAWAMGGLFLALTGILIANTAFEALNPAIYEILAAGKALAGETRLYDESIATGFTAAGEVLSGAGIVAVAWFLFRRPAWTFVSPVRRFAPGLIGAGSVVYGALFGLEVGVDLVLGRSFQSPILARAFDVIQRVVYGVAMAPFAMLIAASEEVVFRGVLLQVMGAFTRSRWGLCLLNGAVFALAHFDPDPGRLASRAAFGALMAWSVLELGGLEFAIGAHFAQDFLSLIFAEPLSAGATTPPAYGFLDAGIDTTGAVITLAAIHLIAHVQRGGRS